MKYSVIEWAHNMLCKRFAGVKIHVTVSDTPLCSLKGLGNHPYTLQRNEVYH